MILCPPYNYHHPKKGFGERRKSHSGGPVCVVLLLLLLLLLLLCVCVVPLNGTSKENLSGKTLLPPVAEGARQCARRTLACTIRKIQGAVEEQEAPTGGRAGEVRHRAGEGGLDGKGVVAAARDPDGAGEHACQRGQRRRNCLGRCEPGRAVEHAQRRQAAALSLHAPSMVPPRQDRRHGAA